MGNKKGAEWVSAWCNSEYWKRRGGGVSFCSKKEVTTGEKGESCKFYPAQKKWGKGGEEEQRIQEAGFPGGRDPGKA